MCSPGVLVIMLARRFRLTGDRTFACYAALQAAGSVSTGLLRIGYGERVAGIAVNQILLTAALAAAVGYLYLTRARKGPDVVGQATGQAPGSAAGGGGPCGVGGGGPGGTASPSSGEAEIRRSAARDPSRSPDPSRPWSRAGRPAAADGDQCPGWESNPHCTVFETADSACWSTGARPAYLGGCGQRQSTGLDTLSA